MAVMDMTYKSYCLKRYVDIKVILPIEDTRNYDPDPKDKPECFKTLYLLHGFSGNSSDWLYGSRIFKLARDHNLAVVMPSGENSFYEDQEKTGMLYGSYIGKELVDITRKMFPLSSKREDTFIGGLSMGGFGSLLLGARFHDTFGAIFALSGGFLIDDIVELKPGEQLRDTLHYEALEWTFGNLSELKGSEKDPLEHVRRALEKNRMPRLYLACGTEDFLYSSNQKMRDTLYDMGVSVTWEEGHGEHEWIFWDEYIEKSIDWLLDEVQ